MFRLPHESGVSLVAASRSLISIKVWAFDVLSDWPSDTAAERRHGYDQDKRHGGHDKGMLGEGTPRVPGTVGERDE